MFCTFYTFFCKFNPFSWKCYTFSDTFYYFSCKFYIFLSVNLNFLCKMILFSVTLASTVFTCRLVRFGSLRDKMLVKTLINTYILVCNFHSPWIWDTSVCICIHCHMGHMALHTIISANLRTEWSFPTCIWQVHEWPLISHEFEVLSISRAISKTNVDHPFLN